MRAGTHNRKVRSSGWIRVLETAKFKPKMFSKDLDLKGSCGTNALSLITGIHPEAVDKKMPKNTDYWKDLHMKKFLRKQGFTVTEITVSRVTQSARFQEDPIRGWHVLLVSQEVCYGEGTWAVLYRNKKYHNFEIEDLTAFEFINNPLTAVYAISHPSWKNMPPKNYKVRYCWETERYVAK